MEGASIIPNFLPLRGCDTWQISEVTGLAWFDPIQRLRESGDCNN